MEDRTDDDPLEAVLRPDGPVAVETWLGAPARSFPGRPASVVDVVDRAVRRWPGRTFGVDPDGAVTTYDGLGRLVEGAVERLRALGVRPGDGVGALSANSAAYAALAFACARTGAVLVGLDPRAAGAYWAWVLEHGRAVVALADAPRLEALRAASPVPVHGFADVVAPGGPWAWRAEDRPAEDATYAVVHTSGTTGRPKASSVVHRCSVHSGVAYQRILRLAAADVAAVLFAQHYISAMHAHVLPAVLGGAACAFVAPASPRAYVAALEQHGVTWAYAVPSWWRLVVRDRAFTRERLPRLRVLAAGGAPFPADLVERLRERLAGVELLDVYGLSETHSPATVLRDGEFAARPGSVGRPLPCMEVAVRDDARRDLPAGAVGEVWLRGSLVTTGYAGDPRATAAAIVDGWFDTGDVGRVDDDGYLWVLDRTKDMINRGGTKVFSAEVEELLRRHPAVDDAAVVAGPDRLAGETVVAFVVPAEGAEVDERALWAWVRDGLADYAAPSAVHVVAELPRNSVGKVDKPALRERLAGGS